MTYQGMEFLFHTWDQNKVCLLVNDQTDVHPSRSIFLVNSDFESYAWFAVSYYLIQICALFDVDIQYEPYHFEDHCSLQPCTIVMSKSSVDRIQTSHEVPFTHCMVLPWCGIALMSCFMNGTFITCLEASTTYRYHNSEVLYWFICEFEALPT